MLLCKHCKKECKNSNSLRNHERLCKSNPNRDAETLSRNRKWVDNKLKCKYCDEFKHVSSISRHENACNSNLANQKECPVCYSIFSTKGTTCSYSCSNTYFRSGENNPNWKESSYRTTCFLYHKKECIICGEANIVEVHHMDEDKENNTPSNLMPLCPTHHQYYHSRFKDIVFDKIIQYQNSFIGT